jgi:hypothetical protein
MSPTRTVAILIALAGALVASLTCAVPAGAETCPAPLEPPFVDVPASNPFCREIATAVEQEWIQGYADGTFRPADAVTRQAAAGMLYDAYSNHLIVACGEPPFVDVPVSNEFCAPIRDMAFLEFITGYADGTFRPGDVITRQSAAAIIARMVGADGGTCFEAPYVDVPVDHPFCAEIARLTDLGIVMGTPDGSFDPAAPVTRQAFAALVLRASTAFEH